MKTSTAFLFASSIIVSSFAQETIQTKGVNDMIPPRIIVIDLRKDEKPVEVKVSEKTIEENSFFRRVRASFEFTNPNNRVMSGEFEFPIPEDAFVCGYSLEIKGEMIPGVVCEKEKARIAFENEMRKGVDPGLVEQVKGNIWRTRIYPLNFNETRRAEVDYIVTLDHAIKDVVYEKDGDDIFVACRKMLKLVSIKSKIGLFEKGTILWDASLSAEKFSAKWLDSLALLPEKGEWQLITFRHKKDEVKKFSSRAELIDEIKSIKYDGGTSLKEAFREIKDKVLLFSDEVSSMDEKNFTEYEKNPEIIIASRPEPRVRKISVEKLDQLPEGTKAVEGRLLATVWASYRMQDLSEQADSRREEFLALGRKYGVAGNGLSIIVLETLQQWIDNKIEPPMNLSIHKEWVKRMALEDDEIAKKKEQSNHEARLLSYWEERIKWWKNPKPEKKKPSSGLFGAVSNTLGRMLGARRLSASVPSDGLIESRAIVTGLPMSETEGVQESSADFVNEEPVVMRSKVATKAVAKAPAVGATIKLTAWNPNVPYLKTLDKAKEGLAYEAYLKERKEYVSSPAFYLDIAGWFYKKGDIEIADRIITNLAEFKLEDSALWRTMGWRLREAKRYELALFVFNKVLALRGEEGQSYRDLALVKTEWGKKLYKDGFEKEAKLQLEEAMKLFLEATFKLHRRRSGRAGNDFQVAIIALEELNGLITWCEAQKWSAKPIVPTFDSAYKRDMPVDLRIVMSWDADQTDIDLHVLEPNGEEAFYGNRRTEEGGFVSEDVTTGYGPEEYLRKEAGRGVYKVLSNYFASHQASLTGATVVTVTIYTNWGRAEEEMKVMTLRLDKAKDKHIIGEIEY